MATFTYTAADRTGKQIEGTLDAKDKSVVIRRLHEQNLFPVKIQQKDEVGLSKEFSAKDVLKRIKRKDILAFTQQLATLMEAGLTLERSLAITTDLAENPKMKRISREILKNVQGGSTFADALRKHPKLFDKLYINMTKAGEAGGVLDKVMLRIAEFLETSKELMDYVISAMIYPALLTVIGGVAVTVLLTFVIPKFAVMFEDMGVAMPMITQILLDICDFIRAYWWAILISGVGFYFAFRAYIRTESGQMVWDTFKLRMPIFGDLIKKIEIARFSRTLGTLSTSGVPILTALTIVNDIVSNAVISRAISNAYSGIKEGGGVSEPLAESKVFPPMAIHMLSVGEETGNLEKMLLKVADTYDGEVRNSVKGLISMLEPALIVIMGGVVGFVVVAMLMAIFSVNNLEF